MSNPSPLAHYKTRPPADFHGIDERPVLCGAPRPHLYTAERDSVTCTDCLAALENPIRRIAPSDPIAEVDLALAAIDHLLGTLEERARGAFAIETQRVSEYIEGAIRDALEGVDEPMVVIGALSSLLRKRMDTKIARRIMIKLAAELEGKG